MMMSTAVADVADLDDFGPALERVSDEDTELLVAAGPIVAPLGGDLRTTDVSLVLSDAHGRIVARRRPDTEHADMLDARGFVLGAVWGAVPADLCAASAAINDP